MMNPVRYLGRYFDFSKLGLKHKLKLVDVLDSFMSDIGQLPIYPTKNCFFTKNMSSQKYVGI